MNMSVMISLHSQNLKDLSYIVCREDDPRREKPPIKMEIETAMNLNETSSHYNMTELNPHTCLSRKAAKGDGYHIQCPNKKKGDSPYCGKHLLSKNDYVPSLINNVPKVIEINGPEPIIVFKVEDKHVDMSGYQNRTDFFNLESIEDIPKQFLFDLLEDGNRYAFDIRTLYDYYSSCNKLEAFKNPYTHVDIPKEKIDAIRLTYKRLLNKGVELKNYKEDIHFDPEKKLEWRSLDLFQKINELGHYSDYNWFWELGIPELKKMYFGLEDLWNYRIFFSKVQKQRILPNYIPFQLYSVAQYNTIADLTLARTVILDEMEKFVTLGMSEGKNGNDNKYTGSILVLTALVEVSKQARDVLPHLVPMV